MQQCDGMIEIAADLRRTRGPEVDGAEVAGLALCESGGDAAQQYKSIASHSGEIVLIVFRVPQTLNAGRRVNLRKRCSFFTGKTD